MTTHHITFRVYPMEDAGMLESPNVARLTIPIDSLDVIRLRAYKDVWTRDDDIIPTDIVRDYCYQIFKIIKSGGYRFDSQIKQCVISEVRTQLFSIIDH